MTSCTARCDDWPNVKLALPTRSSPSSGADRAGAVDSYERYAKRGPLQRLRRPNIPGLLRLSAASVGRSAESGADERFATEFVDTGIGSRVSRRRMDRLLGRWARWALWGLLPTALVTAANIAMAAESADPGEALIRRGVELRKAGRDEQALDVFRSAYRVKATPRAQAQMGFAEQALGHWIDAENDLKAALASHRDPWISRNLATLKKSLSMVAEHLGSVEIVGSPVGARVMLDERAAGELPLESPVRAPAGEVLVKLSAPGFVDISRKLMVVAGGLVRESIVLQPANPARSFAAKSVPKAAGEIAAADDPARPMSPVARRSPSVGSAADERDAMSASQRSHLTTTQIWGVAVATIGVASAGVGTLFLTRAISKNNESRTGCRGDLCDAQGAQARLLARKDGNRATVAFAAGGALVAGGLTLFLVGRHSADPSSAARIVPVVGPGRFAMVGTVCF